MTGVILGVDIGTSSSKGVIVTSGGRVVRTASRAHDVDHPHSGHVEMDAELWWSEFVSIASELTDGLSERVDAVGVSGMGPCVLLTDSGGTPVRPAILYGIDTRAQSQIVSLTDRLGEQAILQRCGSVLTTQAVGPKLAWVRENEPHNWGRTRRLFMPSSWLAWKLTGEYRLDYHSASQCTPLFDIERLEWYAPWCDEIAPGLELPELGWPGEVAGVVGEETAGIAAGTPVVIGTIDAWTEAVSVGAVSSGDLMLMYGTTMFMIATVDEPIRTPSMWGTVGAFEGTRNLAGGLATSGAITSWLRALFGDPSFPQLLGEAQSSGPGARGLLMLPYFAGERTPIMDPNARGTIVGLTIDHDRGDLYRSALEATAFAVRHNVETMSEVGADVRRIIAVGGGTQGSLWLQIVSDVTGLTQLVPSQTIGASYGAAFLAAALIHEVDIDKWNPVAATIEPDDVTREFYDATYQLYRELHPATREINHALADFQSRPRAKKEEDQE